jgi:SecD/SecF fusion protein
VTSRRRNLSILGAVAVLLTLALLVILPGTPLSKDTKLGLDLKGGVELVYKAEDPKGGEVEPQQIEDAIETIRKRTDNLGVSEPEIQRSGADQISVGLPDVDNAERAEQQVGTTAQLQFYDWEPNIIGENGEPVGDANPGLNDPAPQPSLYDAATLASEAKPSAEEDDVPSDDFGPTASQIEEVEQRFGGDQQQIYEYWDRDNDSGGEKFYLFGPGEGEGRQLLAGPDGTCEELLSDYEENAPPPGQRGERKLAKDAQCITALEALGSAGPPEGSEVLKVPRGILVIREDEEFVGESERRQPEFRQPHYAFEDDAELSGDEVENPEQNFDQQGGNEPIVTFELTDRGKAAFEYVTARIADRGQEALLNIPPGTPEEQRQLAYQQFAIALDNELVSRATVDPNEFPRGIDPSNGAQIEGIGSLQETQDLAENLRIGALPVELELVSKTQVSATLGKQALRQGLLAGAVGLGLTILFLLAFYRALGAVAALTLFLYALFLFALVKLIPITLTLPGIAGMILTLAVAADANIVMYERIKEEARTGVSIPRAISAGYTKALKTIIDANVVTIGVAFILFMLATAGVKGFAFTLGVGTLVSLFTAVLGTSAILGTLARTRFLGAKRMLGVGEDHKPWRFDFTGNSKWFFSMSGVILIVGALAIAGLGINFGIDFESGTRIQTPLEQPASVDQVREALPPGLESAKIQEVEDPELGENVVQISTTTLQPEEVTTLQNALDEEFGVRGADFTSDSIGPTFGEQIARTALVAIIASLFLISLYIGLRFEFKFAVPVLIALAHDILITGGVYALAEREVTTATVAALLTILGYSLYDTIIVFDRVRENVPRMPRATFSQIINRSMSEVLTRSLVTSLSTLVPVSALMLFGGETLQDFGFALMIGVLSGTYSSIFIAAPVVTEWKEREPIYRRRREIVLRDHGGVVPPYADTELGDRERAIHRGGSAPAHEAEPGGQPPTPAPALSPRERRRRAAAQARQRQPEAAPADDMVPGDVVDTPGAAEVAALREAAAEGAGPMREPDAPARAEGGATSTTAGRSTKVQRDGEDGESPGNGEAAGAGPRKEPRSGGTGRRGRKKHGRR